MKCGYSSFKEWEADMEKIRNHPGDAYLINHVKSRIDQTEPAVKDQVMTYLNGVVLEKDPMRAISDVQANAKKHIVCVKNRYDIWFEV